MAAVDDDGGGGWRLEATVDGDGREVGWGQNIDGGGGRAASLPSEAALREVIDLLNSTRAGLRARHHNLPKIPPKFLLNSCLSKLTLNRIAYSSIVSIT